LKIFHFLSDVFCCYITYRPLESNDTASITSSSAPLSLTAISDNTGYADTIIHVFQLSCTVVLLLGRAVPAFA
jgi:hypothetical protein